MAIAARLVSRLKEQSSVPRHRGKYNPDNPEPYELSRSKVELFIRCKACFWLDRAAGIRFPSIPSFNLNSNTDTLLKRDFDQFRGSGPHPLMKTVGLDHLRPFAHANLKKWENSIHFGLDRDHFNILHEPTNILFGGGLDDVWENVSSGELHIVDYKSTAQLSANPSPISLDGKWKEGYKRQMEMYQWILREKGFKVSSVGFFVYVDGQHRGIDGMIDQNEPGVAWMKFDVSLLQYVGDSSWVSSCLHQIKSLLHEASCPIHSEDCEYGKFLYEAKQAESLNQKSRVEN